MTSKQHVHKYRRINLGKETTHWVLACQLPGCTHYTPMNSKLSCPYLIGKVAICNSCGDRFVLDRRALRMAKPVCISCVKSKPVNEIEEFLKKVSNGEF